MKHTRGVLLAAWSVLCLQLTGCGGAGDQPELGQVKGTITLDGAPLPGVLVQFSPESGRPAMATTDPEGKYELRYIRDTMGTKIGKNRVEIAASEDAEDSESGGDDAPQPTPKPKKSRPKIPAKYNSKTELEADVKPGENTFNFDLKST